MVSIGYNELSASRAHTPFNPSEAEFIYRENENMPSINIIVQDYSQALNTYLKMFVGYLVEVCLTCC